MRPGTVLDGELIVFHQHRVDFAALQRRLTGPHQVDSGTGGACLVVFDILAKAGKDVRALPYEERRRRLVQLLQRAGEPLALMPATDRPAGVGTWLTDHQAAGVEGVVAKPLGQAYLPGRRGWVKVRPRDTVAAVVGGVTGPLDAPTRLILGRPNECGRLRIIGPTVYLSPAARAELAAVLRPPRGPHPWPVVIPAGRVGLPGGAPGDLHAAGSAGSGVAGGRRGVRGGPMAARGPVPAAAARSTPGRYWRLAAGRHGRLLPAAPDPGPGSRRAAGARAAR